MKTIDRARLQSLMQREQKRFVDERPKSQALFERARKSLLAGFLRLCGKRRERTSSMWTDIVISIFAWATRER